MTSDNRAGTTTADGAGPTAVEVEADGTTRYRGSTGSGTDPVLAELAAAYGVATGYVDADGREVTVAPDVVRAVLRLLDVDVEQPAAALAAARDAPWRRPLPPCVVVRRTSPAPVVVRLPAALATVAKLEFDVGGRRGVSDITVPGGVKALEHRTVDGLEMVGVPLTLPVGLPIGDHVLRIRAGAVSAAAPIIVVPDTVPDPLADTGRTWGWMLQLYALRSAGSWGIGDYADLAAIASWAGSAEGCGADVLLVNPVHAVAPVSPVEPSPYYPASRRFASPLYLRPQDLPEYAAADAVTRTRVDQLAARARAEPDSDPADNDLLDRDRMWRAKLSALELLFAAGGGPEGPTTGSQPRESEPGDPEPGESEPGDPEPGVSGGTWAQDGTDTALTDFATWCALAERHGRDWRSWPVELSDPRGPAVAAARVELRERIAFHRWLQRCCDAQLRAAQSAARAAGMTAGIIHDLAVGVDPGGADAWALQDLFAAGATIGAPPDGFNQQGQDWALPPWRPDRLVKTGYLAFRQMLAAGLRRGGGLRIDHVLGLFRLWWIPAGNPASAGTYVRYDAEAMLGLLALEATRAGGLVVGEDLGTVEPSVASMLARTGVLGSTVAWFEHDTDGRPRPPQTWRQAAMASVTTHDLPTVAGYLAGEHVRVRGRRGLLRRSEETELAAWLGERDSLIDLLRDEGLLTADRVNVDMQAGIHEVVFALHTMLVRSPSRIVLAAPGDAVGDLRQPNLPGTVDSYPNWRFPVTDADGRPVTVERLRADPQVLRLARLLSATNPGSGANPRPGDH